MQIRVLDHGSVRLVDYMGSDLAVVRSARVSYDAAWRAGKDENSDARLIRYLLKNRHTSPFESVEFQFEVKLPIFVVRQWHRHRTWSYNEVSARYREIPLEFYFPDPATIGTQATHNKQVRSMEREWTPEDKVLYVDFQLACQAAGEMYQRLLNQQWPRELARMVLPLNTYTWMFAKVNLHNLLRFIELRLHSHAQLEIQQYAAALLYLAAEVAPVTIHEWKALQAEASSE